MDNSHDQDNQQPAIGARARRNAMSPAIAEIYRNSRAGFRKRTSAMSSEITRAVYKQSEVRMYVHTYIHTYIMHKL